jgi:hypothetical protein
MSETTMATDEAATFASDSILFINLTSLFKMLARAKIISLCFIVGFR